MFNVNTPMKYVYLSHGHIHYSELAFRINTNITMSINRSFWHLQDNKNLV